MIGNFICKKCEKEFNTKYHLNRHLNRTTDCVTGSKSNKTKKIHVCLYCNGKYSRKDALDRHKKTCKKKLIKLENYKINGRNINVTNSKNGKNCHNNNSNNNNNNNNGYINNKININLIVFAKDGIKNITIDDLTEILKSNESILESMIKNVNLNPRKPQHHNVLYKDMKIPCGEVYENGEWVSKKIDDILETLIIAKIDDLEEILDTMGDILSKKSRNKIKEAIKNVDLKKPGARKKLKSYLRPILYNSRDLIIKTRKLTKEQEEEIFKEEQQKAEIEAYEEEKKLEILKRKKKQNKQIHFSHR